MRLCANENISEDCVIRLRKPGMMFCGFAKPLQAVPTLRF